MAGWRPDFPKYTTIGSDDNLMKIKIDKLQPDQIKEAKAIFTASVRTGPGVGLDEYTDAEIDSLFLRCVESNCIGGRAAIVFTDDDNAEVVAVWLMYPSPLVRSSLPLYAGGYFAVNQKHQGKGMTRNKEYLLLNMLLPRYVGYIGHLARFSLLRKTLSVGEYSSFTYKGVIPDSLNMAKYGRVADVIIFAKASEMKRERDIQKMEMEMKQLTLPVLNKLMYKSPLSIRVTLNCHTMSVKMKNDVRNVDLHVRSAQMAKDVLLVEELIRDSAERGDNFGLDEFDEHGFFNRRLLRHSHVILAETPDGVAVGGAVFGPSELTRSTSTTTLAVYVVTSPVMADSNFEKEMLKVIMQWATAKKYESILLDIYHTDYGMQIVVNQLGFDVVGSFPHSGYIKGQGLTNCVLYHRYLKQNDSNSLTSLGTQNVLSRL